MQNLKKLPSGYYAVSLNEEERENGIFTYKGVKYSAKPGVNLFACLNDAYVAATEIPTEIIQGLKYESFDTPVVLMGAGNHDYNNGTPGSRSVNVDHSIAILGEGASVNPNVPADNPNDAPLLNPERKENETLLTGSFWWGRFIVWRDVEKIIFDGLSLLHMCIEDDRSDNNVNAFIAFRNIIYESPMFRTLFRIAQAKAGTNLHRTIEISNIRIKDMDDCDYGNYLITPAIDELILDGVVIDTTSQVVGFSSVARDLSNIPLNSDRAKITVRNSFFKNLKSENGICTSCDDVGDRRFDFEIENTTFVNASREGESPLNAALPTNNCYLSVKNSRFVDTRGNEAAAISVRGNGENVVVENTVFEGFGENVGRVLVKTDAPDYLENRDTDWESGTEDSHTVIAEKNADFSALDALYEDRRAYYGDLHVHTNCGGTSDGGYPMKDWPAAMDAIDLDFAAVVDHGQMRGFFLPEWDEERFIIGTEPGTYITDLENVRHGLRSMHYCMMFPHKYGLAMVLANFPEFNFRGDELTGHYVYPSFTKARIKELVAFINSIGGVVVHAHPKEMMCSENPLDYYIGEHSYIETIRNGYGSNLSSRDYETWKGILAAGKHMYASAGSDTHNVVKNNSVSTFYTKEKCGRAFFDVMKSGDFSVGAIGMKMEIDGAPIGSELVYREGMTLNLKIDDFYKHEFHENTPYRVRVITDKGIAYESTYNGKLPQKLSLKVQNRMFYRVEIFDTVRGYIVSHTNPIWLDKTEDAVE